MSNETYETDGPWREIACVRVPVDARRRHEWVWGEQKLLPTLAAKESVDLVHSLANTAPLRGRFRRVVTIQDLIYRVYPEAHSGLRSIGMRVLVPLAARRAHRIIVPSASTGNDVQRLLHVPPGKIDVIPDGVTVPDGPQATSDGGAATGARPRPTTGAPHRRCQETAQEPRPPPRRVGARACRRSAPSSCSPATRRAHEDELRAHAAAIGVSADTRFLGWISNADLEGFYAMAEGFIFPSLYEGFGLPVLEAMARGVPVACSDRASLPEVAGDAALLFDPEQTRAIAAAITVLATDSDERERLRCAGLEQAARFTWAATARETRRSYERARVGESAAAP